VQKSAPAFWRAAGARVLGHEPSGPCGEQPNGGRRSKQTGDTDHALRLPKTVPRVQDPLCVGLEETGYMLLRVRPRAQRRPGADPGAQTPCQTEGSTSRARARACRRRLAGGHFRNASERGAGRSENSERPACRAVRR
jgi:hypothetical protein